VWDVKDAGLQAASRVAAASDPLALLAEISQNFPSIVSSLTRQQVRGMTHRGLHVSNCQLHRLSPALSVASHGIR
jgi:hypothetical protein